MTEAPLPGAYSPPLLTPLPQSCSLKYINAIPYKIWALFLSILVKGGCIALYPRKLHWLKLTLMV